MNQRSGNLHLLGSPGFVIGLSLLILNDFVLKEQFHNAFTGKLSDFAGLFVFSLFWIAFFPRRKTLICISIAVLFVFWKSAYSQFVIAEWNRLPFFGIDRTVDYSDLWALLILPLSYFYCKTVSGVYVPRRLIHAIALVSVVAFTATQFRHEVSFDNRYEFQSSKQQMLMRMSRLPKDDVFWKEGADAFEVSFDSCTNRAKFKLQERENRIVITLTEMVYRCSSPPNADTMRQYFEKEFIDRLREEPVTQSTRVLDIRSVSPAAVNMSSP